MHLNIMSYKKGESMYNIIKIIKVAIIITGLTLFLMTKIGATEKKIENKINNMVKKSGINTITKTREKELNIYIITPKPQYEYEKYNSYTEYPLYIDGHFDGPSGRETYYNDDLEYVVGRMHRNGYKHLDYWVREDGVKMLGNYVIVAGNLQARPRGTILKTSMGMGMVCDTGKFCQDAPEKIDIATTWEPKK